MWSIERFWSPELSADHIKAMSFISAAASLTLADVQEVFVRRYIAANSVEKRILKLQDHKQALSSSVLARSNKGEVGARLTLKDLMSLVP